MKETADNRRNNNRKGVYLRMERSSVLIRLSQSGVDVDGALERFMGNEELFLQFLEKFKEDRNIYLLRNAVENKDSEEMLVASHTLKGVTGNLALTALHELFSEQVRLLRVGQLDNAVELMAQIEEAYNAFCKLIKEVDEERNR